MGQDRIPRYHTIREVAAMLSIGEALTRRLTRRMERPLPTVRLGRLVRVPHDHFLRWLDDENAQKRP